MLAITALWVMTAVVVPSSPCALEPPHRSPAFFELFRLLRWFHLPGNEDPQTIEVVPVRRRFIDTKPSRSVAHRSGASGR